MRRNNGRGNIENEVIWREGSRESGEGSRRNEERKVGEVI